MKTNIAKHLFAAVLLFAASGQSANSQGTFQNLDFESPILPLVPDGNGYVPISTALPSWTGYLGELQVAVVRYNNISLGSVDISFHGPGSFLTPYHGNFFIVLQGGYGPSGGIDPAAIAQTGQIPVSAQSLRFYGDNLSVHIVSFAGQELPVFNLSGGIYGYQEYGVDVSLLAGQTGELRITGGSGNLDYIHFGATIPEPSMLSLVSFGAVLLGYRSRRKVGM